MQAIVPWHYKAALLTLTPLPHPLQVTASTAGLPADNLPGLAAHPAVVPFVQGSLLMLGTACSLALLLALGSRNKRTATQLPAHAAVMLAGAISLWTVVLL